jgi:hypothetical protein
MNILSASQATRAVNGYIQDVRLAASHETRHDVATSGDQVDLAAD